MPTSVAHALGSKDHSTSGSERDGKAPSQSDSPQKSTHRWTYGGGPENLRCQAWGRVLVG
ncbi:hypothetical protein OH77DRAFT_1420961 [Trametes cingulata]|nr:hypothetical protein OH77DRAFT_1420961 [Trametes cingulata]